jgi:hypothetical protein
MKHKRQNVNLGLLFGAVSFLYGSNLVFGQNEIADNRIDLKEPSAETTCLKAQELIGGYDHDVLAQKSSLTVHKNLSEFIRSKPQIRGATLSIQVYNPAIEEADSEYTQLWCKLKSAADIARSKSTLELPTLGEGKNCDRINKEFFDEILASQPVLLSAFNDSGYQINFRNKSFYTGAQWAPSVPTVNLTGPKQITITTTSLESIPGIPVIGGMNYCKFVAPQGLTQLIQDISKGEQSDFSKIKLSDAATQMQIAGPDVSFHSVSLPSDFNGLIPRKADLYWPKTPAKGVYIVSPGGSVAPLHMRSLARQIAEHGHGVFVVHYPLDIAMFEKIALQKNTAYLFANLLNDQNFDSMKGLPESIKIELQSQKLPLRLFGHSLGGAIVGDSIFGDLSPFDQVILYGTSSFIQSNNSTQVGVSNLQIIFGENDGLSFTDPADREIFAKKYGFTEKVSEIESRIPGELHGLHVLPGLNHFCIVNEMTSGNSLFKSRDNPGLAPSDCIPKLVILLKDKQWL